MVQGKGHRPFIKSRKSKSSLLNIFTSYSTPNLSPFPFPPLSPFSQVRVYFVGHGNTEEVAVSSVGALPDKYQVFPFQMLQCCFSKDTKFSYRQREVCLWLLKLISIVCFHCANEYWTCSVHYLTTMWVTFTDSEVTWLFLIPMATQQHTFMFKWLCVNSFPFSSRHLDDFNPS